MKLLVTGAAGFAGANIIRYLLKHMPSVSIFGLDNFSRKGSELNIKELLDLNVKLLRCDIRSQSDVESIPKVDWIIDCAAIPSVLAGVDGQVSSRQLMEHNLLGTINLLEYCKKYRAGIILLSTSRVYSASELAALPVKPSNNRFELEQSETAGVSSS